MERSSIDSIFTKKETQGISFGGFSASSGSVFSHLTHSNQLNLGVARVSAFLKSSQERQILLVSGPLKEQGPGTLTRELGYTSESPVEIE